VFSTRRAWNAIPIGALEERLLLGGATLDAGEFWLRLEYRVGLEIDGLRSDDFRGIWCDGFAPEMFQLIHGRPTITGRVWLAKSGHRGGQERWRFSLLLPENVRGEQDIEWAAVLPPDDVTGWLSLDQSQRVMKLDPVAAYPDRSSAAP